jgi:2-methylaconitate cis-trans-isomerase PrpF
MLMRGGTSKGLFFLASELPEDPAARDAMLLAIMGSGHPMHVDGVSSSACRRGSLPPASSGCVSS